MFIELHSNIKSSEEKNPFNSQNKYSWKLGFWTKEHLDTVLKTSSRCSPSGVTFMFPQHLWKTMKKSMVYATYLLQPVVLFWACNPTAVTECSENGCSEQYQRSYLLLMEPITNNQTDQYSPRNILPKRHFSVPNPGNFKSSHAQTQVFSSLWFLHPAMLRAAMVLVPKLPHTHTSFIPSCLSSYGLKTF